MNPINDNILGNPQKKPILSKTMDIIIVDNIVSAGPLAILNIPTTSCQETIPIINTIPAPIVVGMVSFMPNEM